MMTVERAEILHDELVKLKYSVLDLNNVDVGTMLLRLIQVMDEVIAYIPKESDKELS